MFVWAATILIAIVTFYIVSRMVRRSLRPTADFYEERRRPRCSFCGKRKDEVAEIVLGPQGGICDECVQLCVGIIAERRPEWRERLVASLQDDRTSGPF
ncbi:ClpX C4-type zinc finger protein [Bradyrhizobium sp. HKCCYLS2038]|uniref:ClpX C4-type zinc finger protein n=1 Tax=unclassified Bradyrhizobium TaxID=2631580 RepID=UPI003EBF70A2